MTKQNRKIAFSFLSIIVSCLINEKTFSQPLVINNSSAGTGIYIVMNKGTSGTPIYLVVKNTIPAVTDIKRTNGSNPGWIISEGQYNYTKWNMGTTTGAFAIPFGYSTTDYLPFTFNKTTAGSANVSFSSWSTDIYNKVVGSWAGVSDNGTVGAVSSMSSSGQDEGTCGCCVIDRWWDIYADAATTADLTFSYRGAENTSIAPCSYNAILRAHHWNGTSWNTQVSTGTAGLNSGVGTASVSAQTEFSPWILVTDGGAALPIELLSFTGRNEGDKNILEWETTSETNNDYFVIERSNQLSVNSNQWETIGTVKSVGNSNTINNYQFIDSPISNLQSPIFYYRLKQADFDGNFTYSKTIFITTVNQQPRTYIFPNPASESITIKANSRMIGNVIITDVLGNEVKRIMINNGNEIKIDIKDLLQGMYFIKATNEAEHIQVKFVK